MERYAKNAGVTAAGAVLVFFLIGVISGSPFPSVLFRAIISGIIFGGAVFGLMIAAERYLPGLVSDERSVDDEAGSEDAKGSHVDIVVEDDTELEDVPEAAAAEAGTRDAGDESEVGESVGEETLVEEVQEQTAENAEEIMQAAIEEEQDGVAIAGERSEVDDMPDIGAFAGSFVSSEYSENEERTGGSSLSHRDSSAVDAGNDPAQIARAIQTLLNKDEQT